MKLHAIETGNFKLDGGAMFGVVPKSIWNRTNPADSNNLIDLAARALLIENDNKLILVDTGLGNKQSEKFFSHYALWGDHSLDRSLAEAGFHRDDITDVFLTHLHFDHCGGSVERTSEGVLRPAFKNARYWSNQSHWDWAVHPNAREKASFLSENILPLEESGQLHFVPLPESGNRVFVPELGFEVLMADGHTEKQMLPVISHQGKTLVYMADLIPTTGHIPLAYIMGYDTRPLLTLQEKASFLDLALKEGYYLFFEHDAYHQVGVLTETEKGARLEKTITINELF